MHILINWLKCVRKADNGLGDTRSTLRDRPMTRIGTMRLIPQMAVGYDSIKAR